MEVQHKTLWRNSNPWLVIEESESYYIGAQIPYTSLNPDHLEVLPKTLYEPLPAEQWQDVTGECEQSADGVGIRIAKCKDNNNSWFAMTPGVAGYRLRKVQVNLNHYRDEPAWAFLVEHKVSP